MAISDNKLISIQIIKTRLFYLPQLEHPPPLGLLGVVGLDTLGLELPPLGLHTTPAIILDILNLKIIFLRNYVNTFWDYSIPETVFS